MAHRRAQLRALSPLSVLERGYAVVQHQDGRLVRDRADVAADEILRVRVARGDFGVRPVTRPAQKRRARGAGAPKPAERDT